MCRIPIATLFYRTTVTGQFPLPRLAHTILRAMSGVLIPCAACLLAEGKRPLPSIGIVHENLILTALY
jgi:hypothetical protein